MEICKKYNKSITFRSTEEAEKFMIEQAFQLGMGSKSEFVREVMENIAKNGNGIVKTILDTGDPLNTWYSHENVGELRQVTPKKVRRDSGTITIVQLPGRGGTISTRNFQAWLRENWPQESDKNADRRFYDLIRSEFRRPPSKDQDTTRPRIKYQLKMKDGVLRRFKQNQTSNAQACDEEGNILPATTDEEKVVKPKKKSLLPPKPPVLEEEESVELPACPICRAQMKLIDGRYGPFWGCPNFPQSRGGCRGKRSFGKKKKKKTDVCGRPVVKKKKAPVVVKETPVETPEPVKKLPLDDDYYKQLDDDTGWVA